MFELKHGHEVNHGLIEAFEKLGYGIYRLLNDINILVEFDPSYQDDVLNLFACKPDHADLLSKRNLLARNAEIAEVLPDETATGNDWLQKMQSFPYIRKCETDWLANLAEVPENYLKALSAGIQMHDATLPAATRVFLLNKASALIEDMLKQAVGAHYSVWLLKLHLMHIQNQRRGSASLCGQLMEAFANATTPSWPFIPPCEMFFSRTPQNTVGNWLFEILQEFIEYRQSFSSYFNADPLKTLAAIIQNNNHDLAIERRFVLASKRAGKPALPAQGSPLMNPEQSPNSSIWRQILGTVQK
ncbi:MAG: hypothetical protein ACD_39C01938G0002 [uncultured bacterium]|nr:MAG: hypothetical protein ACD_39C01938G0002 [uncultured bacterium]